MKRIKVFILINVLLFGLFVNFNKVEAAGSINLTSNTSKVYVGDEFTVSVNLTGMSVATLTIKVNVDTNKLEYISGPGNSNFVNGRVIYTWTDPNGGANPLTSGTIATFKFKAKQAGTASFSVSGEFYDSNENVVNPTFSGTSVSLQEKTQAPPSGNTGNNNQNNVGGSQTNTGGQNSRRRKYKFTEELPIRGKTQLITTYKAITINLQMQTTIIRMLI